MIYKDLDKLDPKFRQKVELWLAENPQIFITESWRSYTRQLQLYAQGRWEDGRIVTWTLKSNHQLGLAVDIGFHGKELYPTDWAKWKKVGDSAKKFGIDWSHDLGWAEHAHFQCNGKNLNPIFMQEPFTIPDWAVPACKKAKEKGIITKDFDEPITAYRLCAILDSLKLLD